MEEMRNTEIAKVFYDIAELLELDGENQFKIRAYQRAARVIEHLPKELEIMLREGEDLKSIPGVGDAIAKKITELLTTGKLEYYEKLRSRYPEGIGTLLEIPGIGPKTALRLVNELGITSLDELEKAVLDGRVARLFRMGQKTAENILHAIQALRRKDQRIPLGEALPLVEEIVAALKAVPGVRNLTPAGSLRRFKETIGDIDIMGTADNPEEVINTFVRLPRVSEVLARGGTKASILVSGGLQIDLRLVEHQRFGSLLQYFTGSKQHNINLRERARRLGLKLSEYGITDLASGETELFPDEESFYRRQGLHFIPPEVREGGEEVELAEAGPLPRLIELGDIKGDLHLHSKWSDGHSSIEELAREAKARGYEYIGIADHSAGRGIAHGLDAERLRRQIAEIKRLREHLGVYIFTGIEVDIRADGSLDLPDDVLSEVEVVIAAVHSALNQDEAKMTRRVLRALEHPLVRVLAHPTCRLLGEREPVALDIEEVLRTAARLGKVLEVNAMPDRLDLKDVHIRRARELGVKLIIGTDAHDASGLALMRYGVGTARRGWCRPQDVVNTLPLDEIRAFFPPK